MQNILLKIAGITPVLIMVICINSFAQSKSPVRIEFDEDSNRIDLTTGRELPNYKHAQRGSLQFFLGRLDKPDDFIYYFHDGLRSVTIENMALMKKMQPQFAIWALVMKSGQGFSGLHPAYMPRVHHLAVSFIPLNDSGETERRVYILLDDLKLIEWIPVDTILPSAEKAMLGY